MRKGEEKRQAVLTAAEGLFLSKGYDATSVQDILDVLHISKGGFYHYFATKEDVLRQLITLHAQRAASYTADALSRVVTDMDRINAVLLGFVPVRRQEADFLRMLMPLIERSEGRAMAMLYQDALMEHFLPLLSDVIHSAAENGTVCPPARGMEETVLHITNRCWMTVAAEVSRSRRQGGPIDTGAMLTMLQRYRRAVEVLLDAPYGSIVLLRVEELTAVAEEIRA